ncbi:hypothetical protein ACWF7Q_26390, partial [Streptomyces sp. NPDC054987]
MTSVESRMLGNGHVRFGERLGETDLVEPRHRAPSRLSFGGGKTQTAYELCRRLPGSVVCDPEHVGFGLHRMLPPALRGDFQDLAAWRQGVFEVLDLGRVAKVASSARRAVLAVSGAVPRKAEGRPRTG